MNPAGSFTGGMENYCTVAHSRFDVKYHFVRVTKYRPSGNVTDEAIAEYIRGQDGTERGDGDDKFTVTPS